MKIEPKEFWDDLRWGEKQYSKLMEEYPDKWVAIVNKKVAGVGNSISEAEREAYKKTNRAIEHIPVLFVECGRHIY